MVLNYIWVSFFLIAFVVAISKFIFLGDIQVFNVMMSGVHEGDKTILPGVFDSAKDGFTLAIGYTGLITFWLGILKIGEKSGLINVFARLINPFFRRLFPEIPKNHPVMGDLVMNFSANMLGLDNAATPIGLKAMRGLQELNPVKDIASNAQIMFLVINTAGLSIIPVGVLTNRMLAGAPNPADVFIPVLIATFVATLGGLIVVSLIQRINLFDPVILAYLAGLALFIGGIVYFFTSLPPGQMKDVSALVGNIFIFLIIVLFVVVAFFRKDNVFETFIEGAKEGFEVAVKIIPYLVAMLVGIGLMRSCGAFDFIIIGVSNFVTALGVNPDFVPALPTGIMKSFSGNGARAMALEVMTRPEGPDSFAGRLASILQGTSDTTFYILALYFGSVGIKKTRYAAGCGLLADLFSIIASIWVAYIFFH
jgi:spore maturation protein SpmA